VPFSHVSLFVSYFFFRRGWDHGLSMASFWHAAGFAEARRCLGIVVVVTYLIFTSLSGALVDYLSMIKRDQKLLLE